MRHLLLILLTLFLFLLIVNADGAEVTLESISKPHTQPMPIIQPQQMILAPQQLILQQTTQSQPPLPWMK